MSGDSPNAFTNENVFDFKEGRSSPAPTTSKDHNQAGVVTASVLVEPQKDKNKNKEGDDDQPDFSSPILNPEAEGGRRSGADRAFEPNEPNDRDGGRGNKRKEEEPNLHNGGLPRLPKTREGAKPYEEEECDDDTCIVNCIYYTMECCKCSIV